MESWITIKLRIFNSQCAILIAVLLFIQFINSLIIKIVPIDISQPLPQCFATLSAKSNAIRYNITSPFLCVKFSSLVNFTTKIGPFAWTNGPISFRDLFHSPLFLNNPLITCFKEESKATLESAPFLIRLSQMLSAHPQTSHNLNCQ